jgi:hypothetical protein
VWNENSPTPHLGELSHTEGMILEHHYTYKCVKTLKLATCMHHTGKTLSPCTLHTTACPTPLRAEDVPASATQVATACLHHGTRCAHHNPHSTSLVLTVVVLRWRVHAFKDMQAQQRSSHSLTRTNKHLSQSQPPLTSDPIATPTDQHPFRYCSPTRRAFLSGRFPVHMTGMQAPICSNWLPIDYTLLSQKLKSHSTTMWRNHFVGKVG